MPRWTAMASNRITIFQLLRCHGHHEFDMVVCCILVYVGAIWQLSRSSVNKSNLFFGLCHFFNKSLTFHHACKKTVAFNLIKESFASAWI